MASNIPVLIRVKDIRAIAIAQLAAEALHDGHAFVQRTIDEWGKGLNTFSKPGEELWALVMEDELIGIAGLNQDHPRLSTANPAAACLYESMGFRRTDGISVTHTMHF